MRRTLEQEWAREREAQGLEHAPPPLKLAELLRQPPAESDVVLQAKAFDLHGQVSKLGDEELHELRTRLTEWWPTAPFKDLITGDDKRYTLSGPASAWLFLAPAAEMTITDEQWAQLATSPMIHTEHSEWLRRQASVLRMMRALELMTDMRATAWLRLLDCCPAPPPTFVINACAVSVQSDADTPEHTTYLMQRLVASGIPAGARAWAARNDVAARALGPMLAMQGDLDAQRMLVGELLKDVRSGRTRAHDELDWMSILRAPEFLEALFEILEKLYPLAGEGISI